jgi:hypothetical protein
VLLARTVHVVSTNMYTRDLASKYQQFDVHFIALVQCHSLLDDRVPGAWRTVRVRSAVILVST